jgi:hypothetical protein
MFKFLIIIIWAGVSLTSQIVMQSVSTATSKVNFIDVPQMFLSNISKVILFSGTSLVVTFFCYRYFSFMEFLFAQGLFYILAFGYAFLILKEPLTLSKFLAILCFIPGIILALK